MLLVYKEVLHFPYITCISSELLWTAPEGLRSDDVLYAGSQKGDVFSFGIIMQEVILRGHPYCMLELSIEGKVFIVSFGY